MARQPLINIDHNNKSDVSSRKIILSGKVQGVGFRPFVYRLANELNLTGWVKNCMGTVEIIVQGHPDHVERFRNDVVEKKPSISEPKFETDQLIDSKVLDTFNILESQKKGNLHISIPTDLFLCGDCLKELNDPADRRYRYPFINCTQCGPRYTLIRSMPYDRVNTTMGDFDLCADCRAEYENPLSRRFHAEPVACADCGPSLSFKNNDVDIVNNNEQSIKKAIFELQQGNVLAIKGIGGYHLMCDAGNTAAVRRLREHKHRPHKPLAVMFPAPIGKPFSIAEKYVQLNDQAKNFLLQAVRPILLVKKINNSALSEQISPALIELGVMLPYSPLHHLLLDEFKAPLVATSANISGEPVLIDNSDVEHRLAHVADGFLHHNRKIERPSDDPVYRSIAGDARPLRIGRGLAPVEILLPFNLKHPVIAVGAQMKNTLTLAWGNRAVISSHIGEMHSARSLQVFLQTMDDLQKLYQVKAESIICDAHPGYTSSRWAHNQDEQVHTVYHHYAHASAAYYECDTKEDIIVFAWDGTGYGEDGTQWGGEALHGKPGSWKRVASIRPFFLPGGDRVSKEPWRSAAALCWETGVELDAIPGIDPLIKQAWHKKINSPQSSSVGRLFDAAAALSGVRSIASYEGQGPMELEALSIKQDKHIELPLSVSNGLYVSDWQPLINPLLDKSVDISERASLFHATLAFTLLQQARAIRNEYGTGIVSFSGGVFQNRVLTEHALELLKSDGFKVCFSKSLPVNDAGISFGQLIEYGFKQSL